MILVSHIYIYVYVYYFCLYVILRTYRLFPEGGGQPTDTGAFNDNIAISQVVRTEHGKVYHKCSTALQVGSTVTSSVDWRRRYDHMQQHSSQHLVSALARDMFNAPTVSWWLSAYPKACGIDLDMGNGNDDTLMTTEQMMALEQRVNETIREQRSMTVHIFHDDTSIQVCI